MSGKKQEGQKSTEKTRFRFGANNFKLKFGEKNITGNK